MAMDQAETFEWLRQRSNRVDELEKENQRLQAEVAELRRQATEETDKLGVEISERHEEAQRLREALEAIHEALKEPDGGSYWPARKYLDDRGIYNGDLQDLRCINAVVEAALAGGKAKDS